MKSKTVAFATLAVIIATAFTAAGQGITVNSISKSTFESLIGEARFNIVAGDQVANSALTINGEANGYVNWQRGGADLTITRDATAGTLRVAAIVPNYPGWSKDVTIPWNGAFCCLAIGARSTFVDPDWPTDPYAVHIRNVSLNGNPLPDANISINNYTQWGGVAIQGFNLGSLESWVVHATIEFDQGLHVPERSITLIGVPEPASASLLAIGIAALLIFRHRP